MRNLVDGMGAACARCGGAYGPRARGCALVSGTATLRQKGGRVTGTCGAWGRPSGNAAETKALSITSDITHATRHLRCSVVSTIGAYKHR